MDLQREWKGREGGVRGRCQAERERERERETEREREREREREILFCFCYNSKQCCNLFMTRQENTAAK